MPTNNFIVKNFVVKVNLESRNSPKFHILASKNTMSLVRTYCNREFADEGADYTLAYASNANKDQICSDCMRLLEEEF